MKVIKGLVNCSFCGIKQDKVPYLIAGPSAFICPGCVDLCVKVINEQKTTMDEVKDVPSTRK